MAGLFLCRLHTRRHAWPIVDRCVGNNSDSWPYTQLFTALALKLSGQFDQCFNVLFECRFDSSALVGHINCENVVVDGGACFVCQPIHFIYRTFRWSWFDFGPIWYRTFHNRWLFLLKWRRVTATNTRICSAKHAERLCEAVRSSSLPCHNWTGVLFHASLMDRGESKQTASRRARDSSCNTVSAIVNRRSWWWFTMAKSFVKHSINRSPLN